MNKLALITGASRGIGKAIAYALAQDGYDLLVTCGSSPEALEESAAAIRQETRRQVTTVVCDMGDPDAVDALFAAHAEELRDLTVLVNNAGISMVGLLQDMSVEDWNRIVSVNLGSCFYTARHAIPIMLSHSENTDARGRIINISSVWGNVGASCEVAYSATKGGVNAFTKALGKELAPSRIPVNAIACGCVDTVMNNHLSEEDKADLADEIPAGRFASPDEVAQTVLNLIHTPTYLTGQIITLDGGWI